MSAIIAACRHYEDFGVRKIVVAEWGESAEDPLIIFYKSITARERDQARRLSNGDAGNMAVRLLIKKALNEDEKPIFTIADMRDLMTKVDPHVVDRITSIMITPPDLAEIEDRLKNDAERYSLFMLADRLHKTIEEIEVMPEATIAEHFAYFKLKDKT